MHIRAASVNTKWWPFLRSSTKKGAAQEAALVEVLRSLNADVIGLQEVPVFRMDALTEALTSPAQPYAYVGRSRRADGTGEGNPILYRADRFELVTSDTYWISKNPFQPGSRDWHSALPRTITWAHLLEKGSQSIVHIVNTHFDHMSHVARRKGAMMLCGQIEHLPPEVPAIVMGDLNMIERSQTYAMLASALTDARRVAQSVEGPEHTCVLGVPHPVTRSKVCLRIDYLFVRAPSVVVEQFTTCECLPPYASDHLPIVADLVLTR